MVGIDMQMPQECCKCKLLTPDDDCILMDCDPDWTWQEQRAHCPLIGLEDDRK